VLLKNEGDLLPLTAEKYTKIAVLGVFAKEPRYQGGGSTLVNPIRISSPWEEMLARAGGTIDLSYAPGYQIRNESTTEMLEEACKTAANADAALLFAGLWVAYDREGFDRKKLEIDSTHIALIKAVRKVQKNVIVVLNGGDAVTMEDWLDDAGALVQQLLVGETVGEALADVLFGVVNPSGRLPVTYPKRLEDTPGWPWFPGECGHHTYGEGILTGYRYYGKKNIEPRFPFGHGLSYTTFTYHDLKLDKTAILDTETLKVEVRLGNTGKTSGKEVVQLYVAAPPGRLLRADRELRRFAKIELGPGEGGTIAFELGFRDFAYYDPEIGGWYVETGEYRILVCKNAEEVCLSAVVRVTGTKSGFRPVYLDSQHRQVFEHPQSKKMYLDFLVRKGVLKAEAVDQMVPLLNGNYMGIYNVLTSLLGAKISKAEMQELLDAINHTVQEK
jgi:beta-glucosidase